MNSDKWRWGEFGEIDGPVVNGGSGNNGKHIFVSARELARFGHLFLNGGIWKDERIISQEWIDISTFKHINLNNNWGDLDGYGYQWWIWDKIYTVDFSAYTASGWGGQWITIWPETNTVIVLTGGNYYTEEAISIQSIMVNYIIPSITK